jgi:glutamate N-acetyltransferase/amino-acid N-acetyltransferase
LKIGESFVLVSSTGVIGNPLPVSKIGEGVPELIRSLSPDGFMKTVEAIMTTDTKVKEIAVENGGARVAGIVKGAGMIEPNMATMLCFIYTDADLPRAKLKYCLTRAVSDSFNMLTVDGDTSTNDTVLLTATGARKCEVDAFQEALSYVCIELARMMARDGEGATKYFETVITGAGSQEDAKAAARAVARSSLVKTAIYGSDPNWGRIVAAVGRSGARVDPERITLRLEGNGRNVTLVERGRIAENVLDHAEMIMREDSILIYVDLGLGDATARSFGCDLTHGYVDINANYTT